MVALVAVMGGFYFLVREVGRHGHCLDHGNGSGLDFRVVAAQAQIGDLFVFLHRQGPDFFFICHMVCPGAVAEFTGNSPVQPGFMDLRFIGVTFEAGLVGAVADGPRRHLLDGIGPVIPVNTKGIRDEKTLENQAGSCHNADSSTNENKAHPVTDPHTHLLYAESSTTT